MPNTLLSSQRLYNEQIKFLMENLTFSKVIDREYDKVFEVERVQPIQFSPAAYALLMDPLEDDRPPRAPIVPELAPARAYFND